MGHSQATVIGTEPGTGSAQAMAIERPTRAPRKAAAEDLSAVCGTLAAAFFDDPVFGWGMPAADRRRQILPAFFAIVSEAYLAYGEIYTTDDLVAAAVWAPPGIEDDGERLVAALADVSGEYAQTLFEAFELMDKQHPRDPHHYLFFLGTRPERQAQGIGSALMRPVLDRCDRDGVPAYLEATSERNRRFYLRHGFEVTGEIRLPDGPSMWPMWREPI